MSQQTRLKVETYTTPRRTHYHCILYPAVKAELGLKDGETYHLRFTREAFFFYAENDFVLTPYVNNASHVQILKNEYIRNGLLKVNEWYDVAITRLREAE